MSLTFSGVGDSVTDDKAAMDALIDSVPNATSPWGDSRTDGQTVINIPHPPGGGAYRFSSEVTVPTTKNITFRGEGSNGSRIICDGDYAFFVDSPTGSFRSRTFEGILFDGCGVRVDDQTRNKTWFRDCTFKGAPDWGIKLQSAGEVLGASGGVVGGRIFDCEFVDCVSGGIQCQGDQSDNWYVSRNTFVRMSGPAIQVYSSGWHIWDNQFEQVADASILTAPWINIGQGATNNILIGPFNRFGNEVATGYQPPREAILIGTIGEAKSETILGIRIEGNHFRGRSGGPTSSSANSAIRLNSKTNKCQIRGNDVFAVNESLVKFAHAASDDGLYNLVDHVGGAAVFDREPSGMSWRLDMWVSKDGGTHHTQRTP